MVDWMSLTLLSSTNLSSDNLATLDQSINLISNFTLARRNLGNHCAEVVFTRVQHVVSERTRGLQRPTSGAPDYPLARQNGMTLCGSLFQNVGNQSANAPRISRIFDSTCFR